MLSIVTDEISYDPATAVSLAREWGLRNYELRRVFLKRVPYLEEEGHQALEGILRGYGDIRIVSVSPGLYKCPPSHWEFAWEAGAKLEESFQLCRRLKCPQLGVFGAGRTGQESFQQVADHFGTVARRAEAAGIDVAIEVEGGTWASSGAEAAAICKAVGSARLGINWDVSNARSSGERALPEGYAAVKPYLKHLHLKDSAATPGGGRQVCVLGAGDVGWPAVFGRLAADGFKGAMSVETHLKPKYEQSRACVEAAKRMMAAAGLDL